MKYEYAIKKGVSLLWLECEAETEEEAKEKAFAVLKERNRRGYRLYSAPAVKEEFDPKLSLKQHIQKAFPQLTAEDFGAHESDLYVQYSPELMQWIRDNYAFHGNCKKIWSANFRKWIIEIPFGDMENHFIKRYGKR